MKLLKLAFTISLFNLFLFIVLAIIPGNQGPPTSTASKVGPTISALPSTQVTPTLVPTTTSNNSVGQNTAQATKAPVPTTPVVAAEPTQAPPTPDNRCIIVIDGNQYDVTSFRNQHSGGDIFQCGTDMSAIFHGQHDNSYLSSLKRI